MTVTPADAAISSLPETSIVSPEISAWASRSEIGLEAGDAPGDVKNRENRSGRDDEQSAAMPSDTFRARRAAEVCARTDSLTSASNRSTTPSKRSVGVRSLPADYFVRGFEIRVLKRMRYTPVGIFG